MILTMARRRVPSRLTRKKRKKEATQSTLMIILSIGFLFFFIFFLVPKAIQFFFDVFGDGEISFEEKDKYPPQIPLVSSPPEATSSSEVVFTGYGEAESKVILVVNGDKQNEFDVNQDGEFEIVAQLTEGDNKLSLYGVDELGLPRTASGMW